METEKAKCISRTVLANGIVSSAFVFVHITPARKYFKVKKVQNVDFNLETKNDELDVLWSIKAGCQSEHLEWKKIKLVKYNKNIYGNFVIESYYHDSEFVAGSFDATSLPFEQSFHVYDDWVIKITLFIYYREKGLATSSVADDYDNFFKSQDVSDVIFVVETEEIPAHKQIIAARNDVLTKMFSSEKNNRIEITEIEPEVFKLLLRFIYCGKIDMIVNNEKLPKILEAAKKYSVNDLVEVCKETQN